MRRLEPVVTLRAASGDLTAGEESPTLDTSQFKSAIIFFDFTKLTLPDADDEVDFYIRARYDGVTWVDVENIHFALADNGTTPKKVAGISVVEFAAADVAIDAEARIADNTKRQLPLGAELSIETAVAGASAPTYAYSATVYFPPS
ncbi:MAG: hypothetical protein GY896_22915 [Gammaproteobacteria bacterium]|nr:hypothetical protein [Gammaproteobacteria bacterium]